MNRRLRTVLIRSAQVIGGLLLGLAITEAVFWWRADGAFPHLNVYRPDPVLGVRLVPGAEQRLAFGGNPVTRVRINRDGLRGANLPATVERRPEVIVVGDSQVFGLGVEERETFSARLGARLGAGTLVINGGVPTYGPAEYRAVAAELLARRKPAQATVVFTINMVNDLFEAGIPNAERHAVWDGWAVRKESAPASVTWFPGRHLLFNRSHAFFALRRWWHSRGPALDDRGFASEGTWADVVERSATARARHAEAEQQRKTRSAGLTAAAAELDATEDKLDETLLRRASDEDEYFQLRAARANPGDILSRNSPYAEASRSTYVTADQIRAGAAYRKKLQAELIAQAEARGDRELLAAFATRDALQRQIALLEAGVDPAAFESPLAPTLREMKEVCDAHGARLVVLVLPMDVQVSAEEWKKYGVAPRDMAGTELLAEDIVATATAMGVTALDATKALAATEPGAFLKRDIHMTPKGHQAVADALAEALASAPPPVRVAATRRSPVPIPSAWKAAPEIRVTGSTKAACETKRIGEWLRVACRPNGQHAPLDVKVASPGDTGAMTLVMPRATTLVAPLARGADLDVDFTWYLHTQRLTLRWPAETAEPVIAFTEPVRHTAGRGEELGKFRSPVEEAICGCWRGVYQESCYGAYGAADAGCVATYAGDCVQMLACIRRDPASPPAARP